MSLKTIIAAAVAATVVLGSAAAAVAAPAVIRYDTTLYANAGSGQIGWAHAGQWVDASYCHNGYCWISKHGPDGFVKASAIDWQGYAGNYGYGYGGYGFGGHYWQDDHFCVGNHHGKLCVSY